MEIFRDTHFVLEKVQTHSQAIWCTSNLYRFVWNNGRLDYTEFRNILPRDVKGVNNMQNEQKNTRIFPL